MKFDAKNPSLDKDVHSLYLSEWLTNSENIFSNLIGRIPSYGDKVGTINVIDAVFQSEENTEGKRRIAGEKNNPTAEKRCRQQK